MMNFVDPPGDEITNILSKLPVEDLMQFRARLYIRKKKSEKEKKRGAADMLPEDEQSPTGERVKNSSSRPGNPAVAAAAVAQRSRSRDQHQQGKASFSRCRCRVADLTQICSNRYAGKGERAAAQSTGEGKAQQPP
ncbi:hypothetical protein HAX54_049501 [Datura stramonium]|uniref:Uncharacterized protein n=1 Tax=Datura stramonium TaxID=4076 RepID=A0ABS8RR40_DATST|nr:hypothetical protein [Datura stramonium]